MRYNDDVINAERWNTDLKKSLLPANPDSDENADRQNKTIQKTIAPPAANLSAPPDAGEINHTPKDTLKTGPSEKKEDTAITKDQSVDKNMQVSNPDSSRIAKTNISTLSTSPSKNRTTRRKKRKMFLLSGLLTGLFYRSPKIK